MARKKNQYSIWTANGVGMGLGLLAGYTGYLIYENPDPWTTWLAWLPPLSVSAVAGYINNVSMGYTRQAALAASWGGLISMIVLAAIPVFTVAIPVAKGLFFPSSPQPKR